MWCSTPLVLLHHHHGGLGCREEYITERSLKLKHMNQSGKLQSCQSPCSFFSGKVHRQHHFFTIAERGKRIPESIKWNCEQLSIFSKVFSSTLAPKLCLISQSRSETDDPMHFQPINFLIHSLFYH